MLRLNLQSILDRFRTMIEPNEPIIGSDAGTGLSVEWEQARRRRLMAGKR